ncbi:MAG: hypothetical protein U5M50_10590 [Sphingobium sp.]|nr:hypothetical protein [Sphingobium sp.]
MAYAEETKIELEASIGQIVALLRKAGANRVGQTQEPERIVIYFALADRQMKFVVPLVTEYGGPESHGNGRPVDQAKWIEQKNRQKGRALFLVIKAKLESVESGVEAFEEAFFANIVTADGRTVYERTREDLALEYTSGKVRPLMLGGPTP